MENLEGKVAVVTGAASGMGKSFADRLARAGMKVVMTDVEEPRLDAAVEEVRSHGGEVLSVVADVSKDDSMDELAAATFDAFDTVHVVCNNAGVAGNLGSDDLRTADWKWVIDVNLWGVIHGHRVFLPRLIEQGEGHIVNTASMAGHLPGHSAYSASKWAVVGITTGLFQSMQSKNTGVGVSCLCPGWVDTDIAKSERNRPEWAAPNSLEELTPDHEATQVWLHDVLRNGKSPESVADQVYDAITNNRFWIFTDMEMVARLADQHDSIMNNRNPEPIAVFDA
ncbi:MAG: SDR family NAD(P)-dependent oxidoreductase [Actinomycetia bacterium]|nr:SDR family NAD(P)-dependent oxidoreductase [Actinomycetes bacterium]